MRSQIPLLGCLLAVLVASSASGEVPRPNVIFILIDDQGYYDLGCYGATEIATPRIDAMAAEGVRFTDYYAAAPICSPSRAGLLTGCYPRRIGLETWVQRADSNRGIHPDELTIAELLRDHGYATACIGKWHLGAKKPFLPRSQGFDHYFGLLHNLDPVEVVYFEDGKVPIWRNGEIVDADAKPEILTKSYTDEAIRWIRNVPGEKPFFLYLPHTMLHNPLGVGEAFKGSSDWGEYGDAIQELDHHVGRLFDALVERKIADNTVVVYASDNGRGGGRTPLQRIRGRKLSTYEGGIRVPCIAWGPGLGVRSGHVSKDLVTAMDWYPTLASFAGVKVPDGRIIDGRDITGKLVADASRIRAMNEDVPDRRPWNPPGEWAPLVTREEYRNAFFYHGSHGALAAVRWGRWKLFLNPTLQLHDLENDLSETPVRYPKIARKLRGMAVMFQEEMSRDARRAGATAE